MIKDENDEYINYCFRESQINDETQIPIDIILKNLYVLCDRIIKIENRLSVMEEKYK